MRFKKCIFIIITALYIGLIGCRDKSNKEESNIITDKKIIHENVVF